MHWKRHSALQRALSALLVVALLVSACPAAFAAGKTPDVPVPEGRVLVSQANYPITQGMTESQVILNNTSGTSQVLGYAATIAPGASVKLKASYGTYYSAGSTPESRAAAAKNLPWDLKTTTSQAAAYEAATGETVVTAINADYYNMQTGQASGYLVMEGNLIQTQRFEVDGTPHEEPYFAVLKDGSYAIRDFGTPTDDVAEAISGPFYLIKDGVVAEWLASDTTKAPRNSIGLREDGTVVIFLADGRAGISDGMTVYEVAQIQKQMGCVNAIYLDGGGSATYASRHEGSNRLTIQNHPSDGPERVVASSLLIVSTADQTGKFDHASLSPNNDMYIAGAQVQFQADGVDAGGYPAELPADLKWALADSSFGSIDNTGLFKSNGACGTVTVNLMQGDKVVGTTSIELQEPDELFIPADSLNLSFKQSTDFDLTARYQGRTMELGGIIFDWTITPVTEGLKPEDIGSFDGNVFTAIKAKETRSASISVSFTKKDGTKLGDTVAVEIGRMPQVIFDFEPDAQGKLMQCGEYDWGNSSYGASFGDENMELTYINWNDETNAPATTTAKGPFQFGGTYIGDPTDKTYNPAAYVLGSAGYNFFTWHTGYMKEHAATAEVVDAENGQVRFGDHALRLDYDYTDLKPGYRNVNQYLYYASTDEEAKSDIYNGVALDGTPSGLGVWVYAPEGTPNYWLWTQIGYYDEASGGYKRAYLHFTTQESRNMQYTGIYWDGWMYVEADLSSYAKYVTPEHPLKILNGMPLILLTFIPGGSANENGNKIPMGDFKSGSIYFDNFRVVYGDTVDDMENPEITAVKVNGKEAAEDGSLSIDSNEIKIDASFLDPASENATGINTAKTAIYIDGLHQKLTASSETAAAATAILPNGTHSVTVSISDGFGNVSSVTRYFTVAAKTTAYGTVALTGADSAVLGEAYTLELKSSGSDKITNATAKLRISDTLGTPTVTFPDGCTGTSELKNGVLTIQITEAPAKAGVLATVSFQVSPATARGTILTYSVDSGTFTDNGTSLSFAQAAKTVGVSAGYELTADIMTVGGNGKFYVTKADGSASGRVEIYAVVDGQDDVLVGKTNSSGVLVTNRFCQNVGESFTVYAKGPDGLSFRYTSTTTGIGSDEVAPSNIRLNAAADPATSQNITWFSAPQYTERKAVVEYYKTSAENSVTVAGTSTLHSFVTDNNASQVNSVTLTGLSPATTYHYRVGDGIAGHWSDYQTFTTAAADADTSFFVLGDTQLSGDAEADAEDIAVMNQIAAKIADTDVRFGLQTGDFIDNAGDLTAWNEILDVFSKNYGGYPLVQVMGNHEYYSDLTGSHGQDIFSLLGKDWYSVEFGNVYLAVINCNADLEEAAAWLIADAEKSDCEWKVLSVHQPPYYTNTKGSSAAYNRYLPEAIDKAAIDFVFSGHDHAYARTEPMTGGKVDEENGAVYFICGDLGEKSRSTEYAAEDNPDFHFAKISQSYDAVYLIASTSDRDMTVTAYNLDGSVLDTYTMHHANSCDRDGHQYQYNRTNGTLICSVCSEAAPKTYTGWATDSATGGKMYFLSGAYKTGWFVLGTDVYHFDAKTGIAHKTTITENVPTSCTTGGHITFRCECGETYVLDEGKAHGHSRVPSTAADGTTYYVCSYCGDISKYNLPFIDVEENSWYAPAVDYVFQNELFQGVTRITFEPNTAMNRAMLVMVLWRAAGSPNITDGPSKPYSDCRPGAWYSTPVNWAAKNNIVLGYTDGTFRPLEPVSRQQIVTILYRYAQQNGIDVSATTSLSSYVDESSVSSYAKDAMTWAVAAKIINGLPGSRLDPRGTATRAQVATIMMRFMALAEAAPQKDAEQAPAEEQAETPAESAPEEAPVEETPVDEIPAETDPVEAVTEAE